MGPAASVGDGRDLALETGRVETIVSVLELYDVADRIPNGVVVTSGEVLERLKGGVVSDES